MSSEPHYTGDIPINPGIRRLVAFLQAHGVDTCDSGDGETRASACDREYPYVSALADEATLVEEANHLRALLDAEGVDWTREYTHGMRPYVQATYSPIDGYSTLEVGGLRDRDIWPEGE